MPTDDIQVEQVGFYEQWMAFLYQYVTPLQQKVFEGHVREVSTPQGSQREITPLANRGRRG